MRHGWALLALIVGALIGAVATFVALDPAPPEGGSTSSGHAAPVSTASAADVSNLDGDLDDAALARHLEQAHFQFDWARAAAVEKVLRERRARERRAREATAVAAAQPSTERPSLPVLDHRHRRETFERRLEARSNAATRAASATPDPVEREERLVALMTAQVASPQDEVVRADAAELLARQDRARARQALLDALADPRLALTAARALARAGDPLSTDALLGVMRDELDPGRRALVAQALAESAGLVEGELVPAALIRAAQADHDVMVRTHALATLARSDLAAYPGVRSSMIALAEAEAEDAVVRQAVIATIRAHHALALDTPGDLRALLLRLLDSTTGPLRDEVIQGLREMGEEDAIPRLEAAIPAAQSAQEREALADALERIKLRRQPP